MDNEINLVHQSGFAVISVFALDYLKRAPWFPWLSANSETINRVVSLAVALFTTVGLKVLSSQGNIHTGGVITIAYPSIAVIIDTLMHASTQYGGQELLHKLLGNHVMSKQMLEQSTALTKQFNDFKEANTPKGQ